MTALCSQPPASMMAACLALGRTPAWLVLGTCVAGTVLALLAAYLKHSPSHVPRRALLCGKLRGQVKLSWSQVLRACLVSSSRRDWPAILVHVPAIHPEIVEPAGACPVLWQTPMGQFWGRREEKTILQCLFTEQYVARTHDYARPEIAVQPGDVVVDAGAHLGTFTRFALDRGASKVIAFEPEATNAQCFRRTFRRELESGRVIFVEAALWDREETLEFWEPSQDDSWAGSAVLQTEGRKVRIPAVTLDSALAELRVPRVDVIKMDIEGAERRALLGAARTIANSRCRMALAIEHQPDDPDVIASWLKETNPSYRVIVGESLLYCY